MLFKYELVGIERFNPAGKADGDGALSVVWMEYNENRVALLCQALLLRLKFGLPYKVT